jgi:hypothetical protein
MKKILQLFFAMVSTATLSACYIEEPIDKYVDTWKSRCFSYVATDGNTYFTKIIRTFKNAESNRVTDLEISASYDYAFYDATCSQSTGSVPSNGVSSAKLTLIGQAKFLGQSVDAVTWTELKTGEVLSGYMNADKQVMYLVTFKAGETPSAWGVLSPYTKQ